MITEEKLIEIFESHENDEWARASEDTKVKAINLLRDACPFDEVPRIIQGADHDVVYLIDVDEACKYLTEEQAHSLAVLGVMIYEDSDTLYVNA